MMNDDDGDKLIMIMMMMMAIVEKERLNFCRKERKIELEILQC